jgi:cyclophilin family peptidyl-prolyl cis-trans isomerase
MSLIRRTRFSSSKRCLSNGLEKAVTRKLGGFFCRSPLARSLRIEPLEDRNLLSVVTTLGIGAPVLVAFDDPTATAGTTFSANSTNADVTATVLNTSKVLKMQVHTVNDGGSTGTSGEMDFLLLDDYAPDNIAHITTLVNQDPGFYNGLTFHRIIKDFMIQGGDPLGNGTGGSGPGGTKGDVQDDEFNGDMRFTSSGLLALANSGPDTNDCQFFITADASRNLDYQYVILGKLVAGDAIRQAIANVPVEGNGQLPPYYEVSKPVKPPIIDSISIVSNTQYGLVMLTTATGATAGETASVTVVASDGSTVTLTGSDGIPGQPSLDVELAADTPSIEDRPAFIEDMPDVYTTMNQPVTVPIPVVEGDAGVRLLYSATLPPGTRNLSVTTSGSGPTDGTMTVTPSGDAVGVYSLLANVRRDSTDPLSNRHNDSEYVALFVRPVTPASLSITTPGLVNGGTTHINNNLSFNVTGVTSGLSVGIFADDNPNPIGTATAFGDTVDIHSTVPLADGLHTFTVKQWVHYSDTAVGNRTIPAGNLYSDAWGGVVTFTVDAPPTAQLNRSNLTITDSTAEFLVTYSNSGDMIVLTTIDDNDIRVTGPNAFDQLATLVSAIPNTDGSAVAATYRIDAPGGVWTPSTYGLYTIAVKANEVREWHGNYVAAGTLLTFNPDSTPPTVTINQAADQADPTNDSTINFTVVFSEPVADFDDGDVTIDGTTGATTATVTASSDTTYNVAVTGMAQSGTVIVSLHGNVAHDGAGNPNDASTSDDNTVTYDITRPTVTIHPFAGQTDPTSASTIYFAVVFSEEVTGFAPGDVTLDSTAGPAALALSGSGTTYTVAVTGMTQTGTVTIGVPADVASDAVGNLNEASAGGDNSVTYDITPPTVTIDRAAGQADSTNGTTINFAVVFSKPVTGFGSDDITISGTAGATTASISGNGATYNVAISGMTGDGTVVLDLRAGAADDEAGNASEAPTIIDNSVTYDTTPPTVTVNQAADQADPTNAATINFTVVFSEPVTGFGDDDVTITGATNATVTAISGTTYNVAVTGMTDDGTVIVTLPAGAAVDAAGNPNTASTSDDNSVTYDGTAPTVTINQAADQADPTNGATINFTVVFSEPVADFADGDVTIEGTAGATTALVTGSGTTYNVAVTGMTQTGTVIATVAAGVAQDEVGNLNAESTSDDNSVFYDATPPTVIIDLAAGQADPTNGATVNFAIVFSEPVTDFTSEDVTIGGTAGATAAAITGSGTTYNVAVSGMTGDGTVIVTLQAGAAHDEAGNPSEAPIISDNSVTLDTTPPTVTINQAADQADPVAGPTVNFTVVFSEPVTDFTGSDVTIGGTAGATTAIVTGSGTTYNVAVSGMTGDGTVTASLKAGVAHDAAGNPNAVSTSNNNSVTVDITRPRVTVNQAIHEYPTSVSPINYTVVFSEPVGDFTVDDVAITFSGRGTLTAVVTGSGTTYNVAVSGMTGDGTMTASIAAGAAHDAVGNPSLASTGSDNVVQYLIPPDISAIVVAELAAPKNYVLESNEILRITWAASSHYHVVSQSMTVDGKAIAPINGPYSGLYYSCPIGTWSAGSHTYTIRSVDLRGVSSTRSGTFDVAAGAGPYVYSVVPAEAVRSNGILESGEPLKITWGASCPTGIASQTMTLDGGAVAQINGPYGGLYYSCPIGTLSAGVHNYTIRTTDASGVVSTNASSFTVSSPAPPTISLVVVAEAGAPKNSILESNEKLKITWAASAAGGIASQRMTIDGKQIAPVLGKNITPITGPYSGLYYSCPIGTWSAGPHSYTIRSTDSRGVSSSSTGTFTVAAALTVDGSAAAQPSDDVLSDAELAPIAAEAVRRLETQLGSQVETTLAGAAIKIADLPADVLGETSGNTIWIDNDAAGYGWFVDPTPGDDVEFGDLLGSRSSAARPDTAAAERVDLLTAVMHEMGHLLGYQHAADDLMQAVLPLGVRRTFAD